MNCSSGQSIQADGEEFIHQLLSPLHAFILHLKSPRLCGFPSEIPQGNPRAGNESHVGCWHEVMHY